MDLFLIMLGAALLYVGGEVLVKNATRLARAAGVSPLTVGLTVVAFCTSSPELVIPPWRQLSKVLPIRPWGTWSVPTAPTWASFWGSPPCSTLCVPGYVSYEERCLS